MVHRRHQVAVLPRVFVGCGSEARLLAVVHNVQAVHFFVFHSRHITDGALNHIVDDELTSQLARQR